VAFFCRCDVPSSCPPTSASPLPSSRSLPAPSRLSISRFQNLRTLILSQALQALSYIKLDMLHDLASSSFNSAFSCMISLSVFITTELHKLPPPQGALRPGFDTPLLLPITSRFCFFFRCARGSLVSAFAATSSPFKPYCALAIPNPLSLPRVFN
jgi:hypothetical protein